MTTAVLATRHGSVQPSVEAVVAALGISVAAVVTAEGPEDNEFSLPPGAVDRIAEGVSETGAERVVIDGLVHPGQMVDLEGALPPVDLADRRDLYYERLAGGGNPTARTALSLRRRRIERRAARNRQRDTATTGPTGESGRVSELDRACDRLAAALDADGERQRRRVETSYESADAHVAVVGTVRAATEELWEELTGTATTDEVLCPAQPATAVTTIGPHEVAVTNTPGIPAEVPEWFTAAVPGAVAAVERADLLVVNGGSELALDALQTDQTVIHAEPPRGHLTGEIRRALPTVRLTIGLPYTDEAKALLSRLYDEGDVENVTYGEEIEGVIVVSAGDCERVQQLVTETGGWTTQR